MLALAGGLATASARSASVITVKAPSELHLAGTDIYCTVGKAGTVTAIACSHFPKGPAGKPKGLAVVSSDAVVVVESAGKAIRTEHNPASLAAISVITGGQASSSIVTLGLHQAAYISGTRMTVLVEPAKGGGNAIGVIFLDSKARPVPGSFSVGISNQFVTIIGVTAARAPKVVYQHTVY
jgi:hypothetical protein